MGLFNHSNDNNNVIVHNHNHIDIPKESLSISKEDTEPNENIDYNVIIKKLSQNIPKYKILQISLTWSHADTDWISIPHFRIEHTPHTMNLGIIIKSILYIGSNGSSGNFYFRYKVSFTDLNNAPMIVYPGVSSQSSDNRTNAGSMCQPPNDAESMVSHIDKKLYIPSSPTKHIFEIQVKITDSAIMYINRLHSQSNASWNGYTTSLFSIQETNHIQFQAINNKVAMFFN